MIVTVFILDSQAEELIGVLLQVDGDGLDLFLTKIDIFGANGCRSSFLGNSSNSVFVSFGSKFI